MKYLKSTSIRLPEMVLAQAKELRAHCAYYSVSDILRVAVWIGLKFLKPGLIGKFLQMMWKEEINGVNYSAKDVLHTAGDKLENLKSLE